MTEAPHAHRYEWIDTSKGVTIILVVLTHSMIPMGNVEILVSVVTILSSFVIPVFFILAGMTYNGEKNRRNLSGYAISRGRQLLIPYFALYFIMILLFIPLEGAIDTYLTSSDLVFWLIYGAGPPGQPTYLWFLPVLYFGLLLFTVIELATHNADPRVRWLFAILLPLLAFWLTDIFAPTLVPWRLNAVLIATAFCILGYEMKKFRGLKPWETESRILDGVILVILFIILLFISLYNGFTSQADDWYGKNGWLYMVTGISGTLVIFMLSNLIKSPKVTGKMQFLGVHSQIIYEVHPMFFYLVPILLGLFGLSAIDYDTSFALFWPIRFVFAFGLAIPFTYLVLRNRGLSLIFKGRSE